MDDKEPHQCLYQKPASHVQYLLLRRLVLIAVENFSVPAIHCSEPRSNLD